MSDEPIMLLAQLFIQPLKLPPGTRLWMFLPLALCIALVYRVTRARAAAELPRPTAITFANIVVGMAAVAVGLYALHQAVLRLSA